VENFALCPPINGVYENIGNPSAAKPHIEDQKNGSL
jgi:hypothetical protein